MIPIQISIYDVMSGILELRTFCLSSLPCHTPYLFVPPPQLFPLLPDLTSGSRLTCFEKRPFNVPFLPTLSDLHHHFQQQHGFSLPIDPTLHQKRSR